MICSGKVLSQESREIMFHPPPEEGYGWHVKKDAAERRLIEKNGGHAANASHLLHYPDDQVTTIWAINSLHKRFRAALNRHLCEAVLGVTVAKQQSSVRDLSNFPPARLSVLGNPD